mmetsp:Transcript_18906/g.46915  ORF Transcript_18906/g.46915 Transcript_18906/m.46915 type:complete len:215 (+) Transcript_18906:782-1426(+)
MADRILTGKRERFGAILGSILLGCRIGSNELSNLCIIIPTASTKAIGGSDTKMVSPHCHSFVWPYDLAVSSAHVIVVCHRLLHPGGTGNAAARCTDIAILLYQVSRRSKRRRRANNCVPYFLDYWMRSSPMGQRNSLESKSFGCRVWSTLHRDRRCDGSRGGKKCRETQVGKEPTYSRRIVGHVAEHDSRWRIVLLILARICGVIDCHHRHNNP